MYSFIVAAAWAAPADVESALDALRAGRPDHAYERLVAEPVDARTPRAWLALLDACDGIGLGPACRAELALRGDTDPDLDALRLWHDRRRHDLEVDLKGGVLQDAASGRLEGLDLPAAAEERIRELALRDPDLAAEQAMAWLDARPEHPDVLAPLFEPDVPPRTSIGKVRKAVDKAQKKMRKTDDPAVALRWHRLLLGMGSDTSSSWADRVEAMTGQRPLDARLMTRAEQVKRANAVMRGEGELPVAPAVDREAVALKAAAMMENAGRTADAIGLLRDAAEGGFALNVALAEVELHLATSDGDAAHAAAERALRAAVGPWSTDVLGTRRLARRVAVAKALAARGAASLAGGDTTAAARDLMVANQLALEPERAKELEAAMKHARYAFETTKMGLDTPKVPAQTVALEAASSALESGDPAAATASATAAIEILCLPTHRKARLTATLPSRPELASAFALRALAHEQSGSSGAALVDLTTATLLEPWSASADWWTELAGLRGTQHDLLAVSMAQHTAEEPPAMPSRSVLGLEPTAAVGTSVTAALVSDWMRGNPELEDKPTGLVVTRGRVIPYRVRGTGGSGSGGGGGAGPVLNQPFPAFALDTDAGAVGLRKGRIHLVTFGRMDSPSSRRAMSELTLLARKMRGTGLDVVLIGVAIDEQEEALDLVAQERKGWSTLGWDPGLGRRFGVSAVPTTWIVDAAGIARFVHVGYLGPSEYENGIRYVSAR